MTFRNWRLMSFMTFVCLVCAIQAKHHRNLGELGFAMDVIEHSYVEKLERYELYQAAMDGMIGQLDTYSGYIKPNDLPNFQSQLDQEFGGLGIVIERPADNEPLRIVSVLYDSPAFKSGILSGDLIEAIDGRATQKLKTDEASKLLRGKPDSEVSLAIRRASEPELRNVIVRRAIIETESVTGDRRLENGSWDFVMQADPSIAYIRLEIFGEKTPSEFQEALKAIEGKVQGLVLDLRDNAGGLLPTATDLCDMFLDKGLIVSTMGRRESFSSKHEATPGVAFPNELPMAVLINENSASASEVMAACLQDTHRAKVVGERSFGKGSVQNVIQMEGGKAALRITSAYYFPPSGRNIHRRPKATDTDTWGVLPDPGFEVPLDEDQHAKVFQRLRDRGTPASTLPVEPVVKSNERDTLDAIRPDAQTQSLIQRDPSLALDPQLSRAIVYLMVESQRQGRP